MTFSHDDQWVYYMAQIGHELRTPLNIIKGFGDILHTEAPGPLNDQQKVYLQKILDGADDLTIIIDDILEWARISSDQMEMDMESLSIKDLMLEIADFFTLSFKDAELTTHYDLQEVALLRGDRQRLKQALINIVGNAVKYVPAGGEVFIRTWEEGGKVLVSVRDTGPGLSEEDLKRILEPFRRGSQAMKVKQGTGIGLWITQAILQAHGGKLEMGNAQEGGAIFTIALDAEET